MQGTIGLYEKPGKPPEVRIHFPQWKLPDGTILRDVTVFPHLCGTCVGGDHTHVEFNDVRPPVRTLANVSFEFTTDERGVIDRYLAAKLELFRITGSLHRYIRDFDMEHPKREPLFRVG